MTRSPHAPPSGAPGGGENAPGGDSSRRKRGRLRRRVLLLALASLGVALGVAFATRAAWLWPRVGRGLEQRFDGSGGLRLGLEELGDAGPGWAHVEGLELDLGAPERPWLVLRARRGELTELAPALLRGRAAGLRALSARGVELRLELPARALAPRRAEPRARGAPFEFASLPGLLLTDARFELLLGAGRELRLEQLQLELAPPADGPRAFRASGRLSTAGLLPANEPAAAFELSGELLGPELQGLRLQLDGRPVLEQGRLRLGRRPRLTARPVGFGDRARLALELGRRDRPHAVELRLDADSGSWSSWLGEALLRQGLPAALADSSGRLRAFGELPTADPLAAAARLELDLDRVQALGFGWTDVRARLRTGGGRLELESARAVASGPERSRAQLELLGGALDLRALRAAGPLAAALDGGSLQLELRGQNLLGAIDDPALRERWTGLGPLELHARAALADGALAVERLEFTGPQLSAGAEQLRITAGAPAGDWRLASLGGTLRAELPDLGALEPVLGARGAAPAGGLRAGAQLSGTLGDPSIAFDAEAEDLRWRGWSTAAGSLAGRFAGGALDVTRLALDAPAAALRASGRVEGLPFPGATGPRSLDALELSDVRASLALTDAAEFDERLPEGALDVRLALAGPLLDPKLDGEFEFAPGGDAAGTRLRASVVAPGPEETAHAIELSAEFTGGDVAQARLGAARSAGGAGFRIELLEADWRARASQLTLLALVEPAALELGPDGVGRLAPLRLEGPAGELSLSGALAAGDLTFAVRAERLDLQQLERIDPRWGSVGLLELDAEGTLDPRTRHGVARLEASLGGLLGVDRQAGTRAELQATLDGAQVALHRATLDVGGLGRAEGSGSATLDDDGRPRDPRAAGTLDLALEPVAIARWLEPLLGPGAAALAGLRVRAAFEAGERFALREVSVVHEAAGADVLAEFELGPAGPGGWAASGGLLDAPLLGRASGQVERLEVWAPLLPFARQLEGRIVLDDLELGGSLRQLQGSGGLRLERGRLQLSTGAVPTLDQLVAELRVAAGALVIERASALLGGAPLRLDGRIDFNGEEPRIDLRLEGDGLPLVRTTDLRLRGTAKLELSGTARALELGGFIELADSRYTRDVELLEPETWIGGAGPLGGATRGFQLFSLNAPPLDTMRLDVRITSAEALTVRSNVVRGGVRPDLRLLGTGRVPELNGTVYVDPTSVALPATRLRVTSGTVRFDPGSPFVPRLDLRAETRMRGYDLTLSVTGDYDTPDVVVSSVPPLSTADALILIGSGQLPESALSADGGQQTARLIAVYLAQDISSALFGGNSSGESSVLERIELVKGQEVAEDGTDTVEASFLLGRDTILIGDRLLLVGEYDRFKEVNFGLKLVVRYR